MRIGILTFHRAYNCGAMLQAWALRTVLERMGHQVSFPANSENTLGGVPYRNALAGRNRKGPLLQVARSFVYRLILTCLGKGGTGVWTGKFYEAFRRRWLHELPCEVKDFKSNYDLVVIGSDQVINPRIYGWTEYFCGNTFHNLPKIVYAASAGDGRMSVEQLNLVIRVLKDCKAVSVREPFENYAVVLDPTLLLEAADYAPIETCPRAHGYIYMYSCVATDFEIRCAREIAKRLHRKLIITPTWGLHRREKAPDIYGKVSPDRMIGYIKNADYVIAGSFHGTALSVVYHKKFITIRDHIDTDESRPLSFLRKLGLEDRVVNPSNDVDDMMRRLTAEINSSAYQALDALRKDSLTWLKNALNSCHA